MSPRTVEQARVVQRLAPPVKVRQTPITSFGSVATGRGFSSSTSRMPTSITFTLDNSAAAVVTTFVVGDPIGLVQGAIGVTWTQPTAVQGSTVAAVQESFNTMPVSVQALNYAATSGAVQFGQPLFYAWADSDGSYHQTPININEFLRNDANNPNLQTAQFQDQYDLHQNAAFRIAVAAGQIVTWTIIIGGAANR